MAKIIYKNGKGGVAIMSPSPSWTASLVELGKKDVPKGYKFKIIEDSDVPPYDEHRNAWEVDESILTDGVGEGESGP